MKKSLLSLCLAALLLATPSHAEPKGVERIVESALKAADENRYSEAGRLLEEAGRLYLEQDQNTEAAQLFEYAVNSYLKAGQGKEGEDTRAATKLLLEQAHILLNTGQPGKAISSLLSRGNILTLLSDFEGAEESYQFAYGISEEQQVAPPIRYQATRKLAAVLDASHRWEEAAVYHKKALDLAEDVKPEEVAEILVTLGSIYQVRGDLGNAAEYYRKGAEAHQAAGRETERREAMSSLAGLYMRERRYEPALVIYRELAQNSPDNLEPLLRSALALDGLGKYEEAYQVLTENRERLDQPGRKANLDGYRVKLLWSAGKDRKAEELLGSNLFPNDLKRAQVAADNGHPGLAKTYFQSYIEASEGQEKIRAMNLFALRLLGWGEASEAQKLLNSALALTSGGPNKTWASLKNNLAESYLKQGDATAALKNFEEALPWYESNGSPGGLATLLNNISACQSRMGDLAAAVTTLERAVRVVDRFTKPHPVQATVNNALGYAYVQMNRLPDAVGLYQKALSLHRINQNKKGERTVLFNLGAAQVLAGRRNEGFHHIEQALDLALETSDTSLAALIFAFYGEQLHDPADRADTLAHAESLLPVIEDSSVKALILTQKAQLKLDLEEWDEAEKLARESLTFFPPDTNNRQTFTARKILFTTTAGKGDLEKAESLAKALVEDLKRFVLGLSSKEARPLVQQEGTFLNQLCVLLLGDGDLEKAFAVQEQWRSLGLAALTRDVQLGDAHVDPALLRERMRLVTLIAEAQNNPEVYYDLSSLSSSYRRVLDQIERQHLAAGLVTNVSYANADQVAKALRPNEALLEFVSGPEEAYLLLLKGKTISLFPLGPNEEIQKASQKAYRCAAKLYNDRSTSRSFQELGQLLLGKAWPQLKGVDSLVVVPDRGIYSIPFAALQVGEEAVIDRFQLTVANSASAWLASRKTESKGKGTLGAALGDFKGMGGSLPPLPGTTAEASQIARLFPEAELLLGKQLTSRTLPKELTDRRRVHIATHGFLDKVNPMLSGLALSDRRVTAADIFSWNLDAELAVLSACDSGGFAKDNTYLGLTSAFQYAGARTMVVSYWAVSDRPTQYWMDHFYRAMAAGDTPSSAMRKAHLATREKWKHPFFWAPFTTWGDGLSRAAEAKQFGKL